MYRKEDLFICYLHFYPLFSYFSRNFVSLTVRATEALSQQVRRFTINKPWQNFLTKKALESGDWFVKYLL